MPMRIARAFFVAAAISWPLAILLAPHAGEWGALAYLLGSLICHQNPERSFHMAGVQLPVCARCTGVYLGAGLAAIGGLVGAPEFRGVIRTKQLTSTRARTFLIVAALPTVITAATNALGWWDASNTLRAALAVPLGFAACVVVAAVLAGELW